MAKIGILTYPDPRLRRVGKKVEAITKEVATIIDDMLETLAKTEHCAALAATQMDLPNAPHLTVISAESAGAPEGEPVCLLNPDIYFTEGERIEEEACMSVYPGELSEKVKRAEKIKVRALDRHGNPLDFEATGFFAKCIQHEVDHLNGKVYLDRLSNLKRERLEKKIEKMLRK